MFKYIYNIKAGNILSRTQNPNQKNTGKFKISVLP